MTRRLALITVAIFTLVALVVYSQFRHEPNRVSGFIEADEIRVGSRIGGRVQRVLVAEGERVALGQDLVQLEPFDLLQREQQALKTFNSLDAAFRRLASGLRSEEIAQAKARYDQFKARLDLLEAGPRDQEINAAGGRLRVAEAELTLAKRNYERTAQLFQRNAVPREEIDAASEQLEAAEAMVIVRKEELELLKSGTRDEEKREARARWLPTPHLTRTLSSSSLLLPAAGCWAVIIMAGPPPPRAWLASLTFQVLPTSSANLGNKRTTYSL